MCAFKSKKQSEQPARRRNLAAEHNARVRAQGAPTTPPAPIRPAQGAQPAAGASAPDKRLEKILKSEQKVLSPALALSRPAPTEGRFDWRLRRPSLQESVKAAQNLYKVLSVAVDIAMLLLVLILVVSLKNLRNTVNGLISDLFTSFQLMDRAAISTSVDIPNIPINFDLPVIQEETYVVLTRDVTIKNAKVGVLNVTTSVTLPAGTALPVSLNMTVPVTTEVTVKSVNVDFDLASANPAPPKKGLHEAFINLQNALGPYYCLFRQDASSPDCPNGVYSAKKP